MFLKVCCLKVALEKKRGVLRSRSDTNTFTKALVAKVECICEASSPKHPHHIIGEKKRKKASLFALPNKKKKKNNADIFAKKLLFIFDTFDHFIYPSI